MLAAMVHPYIFNRNHEVTGMQQNKKNNTKQQKLMLC